MELTFIGYLQLAIGLAIVAAGSLRTAFAFMVVSGLFDGSCAVMLPSLGGASIPPAQFTILFVYLRIFAPRGGFRGTLTDAVAGNPLAVGYVVYGVASAVIAPRLFAGRIDVAPMRYEKSRGLFDAVPLAPSSQNITASIYLLGFLLMVLAAYVVCRHRGGVQTLVSTAIAVGWLHIALGLAVAFAAGTPLAAFFEMFRNGNYLQLDQSYQGFVRLRGLFPESSAFAEFGVGWFVLNAELWYRSIRSRATGAVAIGLGAILFFSTSSTAYVGLAGYIVFFLARMLALPAMAHPRKLRQLGFALLALAFVVAVMIVVAPRLGAAITDMLATMTVNKAGSSSAQQRLFWAMQGWEAFKTSYGLGIGPGSFRSSSIVMAMLGATGIIGLGLFCGYVLNVLQPARASTVARGDNLAWAVGGALATAAALSLLPSAVSSAKADPGANFAIMAGAALALRPRMRRRVREGDGHPQCASTTILGGNPTAARTDSYLR